MTADLQATVIPGSDESHFPVIVSARLAATLLGAPGTAATALLVPVLAGCLEIVLWIGCWAGCAAFASDNYPPKPMRLLGNLDHVLGRLERENKGMSERVDFGFPDH
jgi:hypothetical protein